MVFYCQAFSFAGVIQPHFPRRRRGAQQLKSCQQDRAESFTLTQNHTSKGDNCVPISNP